MNKLPKSWCVKNNGFQLFKDTVVAYLNKVVKKENYYDGNCSSTYYGINIYSDPGCYTYAFGKVLTLHEFIELSKEIPEIVIPKKWYIRGCKELGEYFIHEGINKDSYIEKYKITSSYKGSSLSGTVNSFGYFIGCDGYWDFCSINIELNKIYSKITFDFFKEHILPTLNQNQNQNQETNINTNSTMDNNKELIGYKLNGKASAEDVARSLSCSPIIYDDGTFFNEKQTTSISVQKAKELGVLDLWFEPVYKDKIKEITLNLKYGYQIIVKSNGNIHFGDTSFTIESFKNAFIPTKTGKAGKFHSWEVDIKDATYQIHCPGYEGIRVTRKDILNIFDACDEVSK